MKILSRRVLNGGFFRRNQPLHIFPGDTVSVVDANDRVLTKSTITRPMVIDEVITFEDVIEGKNAICGGFLEKLP